MKISIKKKFSFTIVLVLLLSVNFISCKDFVNAEILQNNINTRVESAKKTMKKDNVDFETYNKVMHKINNGEILESEKENSIPISIETYSEGEFKVKKEVFSDHSYILTKITDINKIEQTAKTLRRDSWSAWISDEGTIVSYDSFHRAITGAVVTKSHGVYWVSFTFDYDYSKVYGNINYTYSESSSSVGGTMSLGQSRIIKSHSDSFGPARAEMQFSFSGYSGVASYSGVVGITVDNYGASAY